MHLPSTSTGEQPPPSISGPQDLSTGGSVSSFVAAAQDQSVDSSRRMRSRRGPDYRLRGLDLSRLDQGEAPARRARRVLPRRRYRRRLVVRWILVLVVAGLAALVLRMSVFQPFSVPSAAMVPTLQMGDRILVVKSSGLAGPIHSGDIVVFRHPKLFACDTGQDQVGDLVQRVIGVPGDTIWSVGNEIYIDGKRLNEQGWYDSKYGQVGSTPVLRTKIPSGRYFVMGDNRSNSCDSRVLARSPDRRLSARCSPSSCAAATRTFTCSEAATPRFKRPDTVRS